MTLVKINLDNRFLHLPSDTFITNMVEFLEPYVNSYLNTGGFINISISYNMYLKLKIHRQTIFSHFPDIIDWVLSVHWSHSLINATLDIGYESPNGSDLDDSDTEYDSNSPRTIACEVNELL